MRTSPEEAEQLRRIAAEERARRPPAAPTPEPRFRLVRFADIQLETTPHYLIKGIFPREGLAVVWGPPKCGKSFWVYDALMHVALGRAYRGHRVQCGPVVYIACEGERGQGARSAAWRLKHGIEDSDPAFFNVATKLDLVADADALIADIKAQVGEVAPAVIAIDTLNRSIAGSESSDEDMGAYVKAADLIRAAFNCLVIVVHHCGIDDKRPRGHTSLTGAADAQIAVKKDSSGIIVATVEYMKDGADGQEVHSALEVVEVGTDTDGEPITSCVIIEAEPVSETASKAVRLPPSCRVALDALQQAIADAGHVPPASNHIPAGVRVVSVSLWREIAYARSISDGDGDAKRKAFKRASEQLQQRSLIGCWQDQVWLTGTL